MLVKVVTRCGCHRWLELEDTPMRLMVPLHQDLSVKRNIPTPSEQAFQAREFALRKFTDSDTDGKVVQIRVEYHEI